MKRLIILGVLCILVFVGLAEASSSFWFYWSLQRGPGGFGVSFFVNVDPRINLYTDSKYSLNSELCEGQYFTVEMGVPSGEWEGVGGWDDSPPVYWTENLTDLVKKVTNGEISIPHYDVGGQSYFPFIFSMNVICEIPKLSALNVSGADFVRSGGNTSAFVVGGEEKVVIRFNESMKCMVHWIPGGFYGPVYGKILEDKSYRVLTRSIPKLDFESVLTSDQLPYGSSTYLKLNVTNLGDKDTAVKDITFNVDSQLIACTSSNLSPGNSTECVVWMSPKETSTITADVKYQYQICGERKFKTEKFFVGEIEVEEVKCTNDKDCLGNYICCAGLCYDSVDGMCSDVNADGVNEWIKIG